MRDVFFAYLLEYLPSTYYYYGLRSNRYELRRKYDVLGVQVLVTRTPNVIE